MDRISPQRYLLFLIPATAGLAADLATKAWMFSRPELRAGKIDWVIDGYAGFQLSWNEGALFGMGQGKVWLFVTMSIIAAVAIPVWLFWFRAARDRWLTVALGCVMGGILGNLYDRVGLHGEVWPAGHLRAGETIYAVRDWILVQLSNDWRWPNFNIADSMLVIGASIMFLHALMQPHAASGDAKRENPSPSTSAS